jgi:competence protein ComEC
VTIVAYFSFLLLLLLPELFKRQKLLTFALFAASLAVLVTYPFPPRFSRSLEITFLDVGQGDSILVEFPGRKKMLIDAGGVPDDSLDIGELVVSSFLWDRGIKKIDYAVLTHAHPDHLNGLKSVARNFQIGQFWEAVSPPSNPAYEELKAGLSSAVIQRRTFRGFGQQEGRVTIKVIHPQDGAATPAHDVSNDESLALRVSLGDIAFLLPSDIGFAAENDILRQGLVQRAQVLKSPHHGSRTSSSEAFLAAVRPLIVVITAGRGNLYGVPHAETLERYRQLGAKVYRTDRDGAVRVTTDGRTFSVITSEKD